MSDVISFSCPGCKLACRVSGKQRAVQHQVPDCKLFTEHRRAGTMQEFLRLALLAVDVSAAKAKYSAKERADAIDQLNEGLKKL